MLDIEKAKQQATTLEDYLRTVGKKLKHTHALEAVARMNGHKSWNTYQAEALATKGFASADGAPSLEGVVLCGADLAVLFASGEVDHVVLDGVRYELRYYNSDMLCSYRNIILGLDEDYEMASACIELERAEAGQVCEEELTIEQLSNAAYSAGTWTLSDGTRLQLFGTEVL